MKAREVAHGDLTDKTLGIIVKEEKRAKTILTRLNSAYQTIQGMSTQGPCNGPTETIISGAIELAQNKIYQNRVFYLLEISPEQYQCVTKKLILELIKSAKKSNRY